MGCSVHACTRQFHKGTTRRHRSASINYRSYTRGAVSGTSSAFRQNVVSWVPSTEAECSAGPARKAENARSVVIDTFELCAAMSLKPFMIPSRMNPLDSSTSFGVTRVQDGESLTASTWTVWASSRASSSMRLGVRIPLISAQGRRPLVTWNAVTAGSTRT